MNNLYRLTVYLNSFYIVSQFSAWNYPPILYTAPETNLHNFSQCANGARIISQIPESTSNFTSQWRISMAVLKRNKVNTAMFRVLKTLIPSSRASDFSELLSSLRLSTNTAICMGLLSLAIYRFIWEDQRFSNINVNRLTGEMEVGWGFFPAS